MKLRLEHFVIVILLVMLAWDGWTMYEQRKTIRDYREYVEAGCRGHYQGQP